MEIFESFLIVAEVPNMCNELVLQCIIYIINGVCIFDKFHKSSTFDTLHHLVEDRN